MRLKARISVHSDSDQCDRCWHVIDRSGVNPLLKQTQTLFYRSLLSVRRLACSASRELAGDAERPERRS